MEIMYLLIIFSLIFSLGFLIVFFWAVDNDQFRSLGSVPWSMLDEEDEVSDE